MNPKNKIIIIVIVSFVLGIAGGFFLGRSTIFSEKPRNGRPSQAEIMREFKERLKLDETQAATIDSLLEAQKSKFGELRKQYSSVFRAQRDSLRTIIRSLLTEEQNTLYDQYIQDMEKRESRARTRRE